MSFFLGFADELVKLAGGYLTGPTDGKRTRPSEDLPVVKAYPKGSLPKEWKGVVPKTEPLDTKSKPKPKPTNEAKLRFRHPKTGIPYYY